MLRSKNWKTIQDGGQRRSMNPKKPWASIVTLPPCGNRCRFSKSFFLHPPSKIKLNKKFKKTLRSRLQRLPLTLSEQRPSACMSLWSLHCLTLRFQNNLTRMFQFSERATQEATPILSCACQGGFSHLIKSPKVVDTACSSNMCLPRTLLIVCHSQWGLQG